MGHDEVDATLAELIGDPPLADEQDLEINSSLDDDDDDEESDDDDDNSDSADERSSCDEEEFTPTSLEVGALATHDFLGEGTVLAIGSTQQAAPGVLAIGFDFDTLDVPHDKVLFAFKQSIRVPGRGPARWEVKQVRRAVFADALKPHAPAASPTTASGSTSPEACISPNMKPRARAVRAARSEKIANVTCHVATFACDF